MLKLFQTEVDWVIAETEKQAIEILDNLYGEGIDHGPITIAPDDRELTVWMDDLGYNDGKMTMTAKEWCIDVGKAGHLGSTEW